MKINENIESNENTFSKCKAFVKLFLVLAKFYVDLYFIGLACSISHKGICQWNNPVEVKCVF